MAEQGLVGRGSEVARLVDRLDEATAGRAGIVLVEGEAGIGKTRLLEELAHIAGSRGVPVVWGRATNEEGAPPFWPWRQVFRSWLAGCTGADEAGELARIAPELNPDPVAPPTGAEQRFALFEAARAVLTRAAAQHGLVVLLDDLHWADTATLRPLGHFGRDPGDARVLIAGGPRPAELGPARREIITELARQRMTSRLELAGLAAAEVARWLTAAGWVGDPVAAREVAERTGGNPLFVTEIGRLMAGGGSAARVPDAVRDAIRQHLAALPAECRSVLATAAVLGVDLDARLVAGVAGGTIGAVLGHLDDARAAGVLAGDRFAHDLVREGLQLDLPTAERARIHLRAAEILEAPGAGEHVSEVAHHRLAALPLGDPELAVRAAVRSAEAAMIQLGYEEAAGLYDRALAAAPTSTVRLDLLTGRATALHAAHEIDAAMRTCERAAALAMQVGDAAGLGRAAVVLADVSDPPWLMTIDPWCARALAGLPDRDSRLRAQLLAQQSISWTFRGESERLDETSAAALAMAERLADPVALVAALRARQLARSSTDGNAERIGLGDRMIALARRTGARDSLMWGHLWRFDAMVQTGRIDEAEAELDALEPVVAAMRQPLARWHLVRGRGALHLGRGRFAEAIEASEEALALAERGGHGSATLLAHVLRLTVTRFTGDDESADPAELNLLQSPIVELLLAERHLAFGRLDEVARLYERVAPAGVWRRIPLGRIVHNAYVGVVAAALGDLANAEQASRELLPDADFHVVSGAGVAATRASARLYLGEIAAGTGRTDAAVEHLRAAVAANTAAGLPPFMAEAQCRLAELLRGRGEPGDLEEATLAARDCAATADRLGMALLARRSARVLAELQGRRRGDPLTRREEQIAELVAAGLSNRQIAGAVHISERTVETHVRNILLKLEFSARTQIASWATARRLES